VFPADIARPTRGVKLLGGPVSLDLGFCKELSSKRVLKSIALMEAVNTLDDPQCELLLLRSCVGVSKLYFALRTCSPYVFEEAQICFDKGLRVALEKIITASGSGFGSWQWRLATLPINKGGLGVYSAGDALFFTFLASRMQTMELQNRILNKTGIMALGNSFMFALEKYTDFCGVDPDSITSSFSVPNQQSKLAAKFFEVVVKDAAQEYDLNDRDMALWQSIQRPHSQAYLHAIPIEGLGQKMHKLAFRTTVCYRLGIPLYGSVPGSFVVCPACHQQRLDIWGDHATMCASDIGVKWRHDLLRDTMFDIIRRTGVGVQKEVNLGFLSDQGGKLKPADLLLYSWAAGADCCVDVTVVAPFAGTGVRGFVVGKAEENVGVRKRRKYEAQCESFGYAFKPFAVSTFGDYGDEALDLLKRMVNCATGMAVSAKLAHHIYSRVSFTLQKGLGAQFVARLPFNFE